jgi:hypothetical protein
MGSQPEAHEETLLPVFSLITFILDGAGDLHKLLKFAIELDTHVA